MSELSAQYFDGRTARSRAVRLRCADNHLYVVGDDLELTLPLAATKISPRLGRTRRQITLPDGAMCELDDDPLLDQWFNAASDKRWHLLAALERHWLAISFSAILIIALTASAAIWGLPYAAQKIARAVPQTWSDRIGAGALTALDEMLGTDTTLTPARQQQLREQFSALATAVNVPSRFEFREWKKLGANALALPDGTIVITDELVQLASDDRELQAVIAHEFGHVHERHALQKIIADSGLAAMIFALTGDLSSFGNIAVAAPTLLTHLHHSRDLESDADRFGFALLARQHIDSKWFASIIRKLESAHASGRDQRDDDFDGWLRSHPMSEQRARNAEYFDAHK